MDLTLKFQQLAGLSSDGIASSGSRPTRNSTSLALSLHSAFNRAERELLDSLRQLAIRISDRGLAYSLVNDVAFNLNTACATNTFADNVRRDLNQVDSALEALKAQLNAQQETLSPGLSDHHSVVVAQLNQHASSLASKLSQLEQTRRRQQQLLRAFELGDPALLPSIPTDRVATLRRRHHGKQSDEEVTSTAAARSSFNIHQEADAETTTPLSDSRRQQQRRASPLVADILNTPAAIDWAEIDQQVDEFDTTATAQLAKQHQLVAPEIKGMLHEVNQAESTMYELTKLQVKLNQKVAEQDVQIGQIAQDTAAAADNVEQGNVELLKAIQYYRDFRWGMLLFFLVLSAALLVLDAMG
eukprot:TRINITY_DN10671_c0_g2_i1.p1 TRINITY_DN10671_c0_g2~~TRINITY_DN10671_c0_g2_i1.p1  ORF type:complete len:357 (+),score=80.07 TRINITY_DN10671_c0_g2_i1:63-1133(+)